MLPVNDDDALATSRRRAHRHFSKALDALFHFARFAAARNAISSTDLDPYHQPAQLARETLLLDIAKPINAGGGSVLSFYHRTCQTAALSSLDLKAAAAEVIEQVRRGALLPTDMMPSVRTCTGCGCVDVYGCERPCYWVEPSRCSHCT